MTFSCLSVLFVLLPPLGVDNRRSMALLSQLFFVRAGDMLLDIHSTVMCTVYACLRLGLSNAGLDIQPWCVMAKATQLWFMCVVSLSYSGTTC